MEATILYGNGLNLISQPQKTWTKLLKELFDKYGNDLIPDHKPYPMVYEELFLRNELLKLEDEKEVKSEVVKFVKQNKINEFYKMLSSSDFKIILRPIMILRWKNSLRKMDMHGNTTGKKLSTAFLLTWK